MTSPITFSRDGRIGLVEIHNPPVNALSIPVVDGLASALEQFEATPDLDALVLYGRGRTWVAGADITALEQPGFPTARFNTFLARLEAQARPVVVALHGTVLGGGLELAMACHHRVAQPQTRLGLPEVKIGIIPGSLGTQRLPRLAGAELALELISSGRMIGAAQAASAGLVDAIAEGEPRAIGLAAARAVLAAGAPLRRASTLTAAPASAEALDRAEAAAAKKPGWPQLAAAVRCVRAAQELPFAQGAAVEAAEFEQLVPSPSARALRHLFFAEREAMKIPGLPRDTALRPVRKVGIVGAGTMGGGIAMNFANAGIPTVVVEVSDEALQRGLGLVRRNYEASAAKGRLTREQVDQRMALLQGALDYAALGDCDLVIEAVFEDLALKTEVCARLGAAVKPGAIIATNTSTLDVDALARATGRPADVVGMHFFSPANVMRLLEVVRGAATAPDVLATVMKLASTIGKVPVVSGVCYGFIGNRMAEVYMREAEFLILEGAEPAQVDAAVEALGMAMGPCRMLDMAGVDVGARTVIEYGKAGGLPPDPSYRALVRKLFELGRFGQKTGAGYYRYEGRSPLPDPQVTAIAAALAAEHGIARRERIGPEEIVERLMYPLINEGLKILDEGIAYRPGDIDVVWVAGYGFPDHRGGPMWMAGEIGLDVIAGRLAHYAAQRGNPYGYWTPARRLAAAIAGVAHETQETP
ncbi:MULTISPECIES: 3-hydroxyacyl-CoA dehydrogenase NAD-binding domain-containing protein [Comamonadaceae]|jgi:3-hydroxyacyl-CoA dehydrogenase|uniref:3-hydroxyacyl-CoA dehydrogenase n=2 Tax=Comamonadaceae TaxID=80864 RepID=A0A1I2E0I5_9BURK|nr:MULTISPECIES: 3-hydroxyacyl-CoA dehydrogenase NAD-binding domain-containing protein [Comamonadaceae]OJX31532.1 MAG: enoyl-CoA hydratase [Burkholderiales bacterium 68-12]GAO20832.1 enoyl-CoA hydratase [Alicycliphilus sp. B1]MDR7092917.1 3-hydroxyacyl-CoA dehydrogenase [Hydrogenophaga laconesensis]NCU65508.1 enoyl-CoA hydratase [Acidovorax sp. 210-6]POR09684.1 enoyl-CoA hydratase [Diaphorobacter sp. LR2014-1]